MQKKPPRYVAAVDLGSNSFHMIVCSLSGGKLKTVDRIREMVRLAAGLDKKNVLDAATQKRALACLERFGERIAIFRRTASVPSALIPYAKPKMPNSF